MDFAAFEPFSLRFSFMLKDEMFTLTQWNSWYHVLKNNLELYEEICVYPILYFILERFVWSFINLFKQYGSTSTHSSIMISSTKKMQHIFE
jgi:hypothetical protein